MGLTKDDRTLRKTSPAPRPPHDAVPGDGSGQRRAWLVLALTLAALNLRPAISSLGPVLAEVRADLGMNGTVAGLLTSLPALCFGLFGFAAPRLARRFGPAAVVIAGLAALTAGLALRSLMPSTVPFLLTTTVALAGIAVGNVLMPVLVKRWFPDRIGTMTGVYAGVSALGAAVSAAMTVPLTGALGDSWRLGIGVWAAITALALLPWLAARPRTRRADPHRSGAEAGAGGASHAAAPPIPSLARSRTAWALAVFFGLQATAAYITLGWASQIFRDAGVGAGTAGLLLAVIMGLGGPLGFVVPRVAARMRHQGPLVAALGACGLVGYAGLWLAPAPGAWVWAVFLGVANCAFPAALTMIGLRARSATGVARLSAFAQSVGYLICIPGPLVIGSLYEATGGWDVPLAVMAGLMAVQIAVGVLAGRDRRVEDGD
ncbi:MFS transporter [Streptomyces sp. PT12]|uniref:CynX/NimT family MFS transporter n=1 Tax=Streptomyces sp. PT12 TaxID=1510197 RepID=UPI000DE4FD9C|nr:MFS transporter [Streptomyces sp. PT12]RBM17014.1 MFS transporter [Streptomyces sp. PT12]